MKATPLKFFSGDGLKANFESLKNAKNFLNLYWFIRREEFPVVPPKV